MIFTLSYTCAAPQHEAKDCIGADLLSSMEASRICSICDHITNHNEIKEKKCANICHHVLSCFSLSCILQQDAHGYACDGGCKSNPYMYTST